MGGEGGLCPASERWAVAFFGIRGVGSVYYLAHALNETDFTDDELLWAVTAFVILVSVLGQQSRR